MQKDIATFGLKELINPVTVESFVKDNWLANKPIVIHSDIKRFENFPFLFNLLSLKEFAPKYHGRVSMIHPDGTSLNVQNGREAVPYLEKGYTVYFRHIQNYFPEIQTVLNQLAKDLGMPANQFTAEIFTSSGISGVPFHSDYDLNFSLLLSGERKEWKYAENTSILNQTGICMPANVDQIEPSQLKYLTDKPLPSEMPANSVTGVLKPGDLIFMPRGWWHTTHSVGECLCVNFVMKGPHWAHFLATALEKDLVSKAIWRRYPYGVAANDGRENTAIDVFSELINELKDSLMQEDSKDIAKHLIQKYFQK